MSNAELIGAAQAARILGISQRQVARRVETGALEPLGKIQGKTGALLFDRAYVEKVAEQERAAALAAHGHEAASA